jgi:hypothetical protein
MSGCLLVIFVLSAFLLVELEVVFTPSSIHTTLAPAKGHVFLMQVRCRYKMVYSSSAVTADLHGIFPSCCDSRPTWNSSPA